MSFKQFLADSTAITAGNVGSLAKLHSDALKGTKEFESITKLDPNFAKKLLVAWEGDARDYEKNKKIDSLFLKMIQPDTIKKMSKLRLDDLTHEIVQKLEMLHRKAMPHDTYKPKFVDKSIWGTPGAANGREMKEYVELCDKIEILEAKFFHQGKTNSSKYDVDAALKSKSTKELDDLIKKYSMNPGSNQMKAYIVKAKAERAKRIGK